MQWNYILKLADLGVNNLRVLDRIFKWMVIIDKKIWTSLNCSSATEENQCKVYILCLLFNK